MGGQLMAVVFSRGIMESARSEEGTKGQKAVDTGGPPCSEAQADGVPCEEMGTDCEDCDRAEAAARETYKARGEGV
jgi:hypothetical protein